MVNHHTMFRPSPQVPQQHPVPLDSATWFPCIPHQQLSKLDCESGTHPASTLNTHPLFDVPQEDVRCNTHSGNRILDWRGHVQLAFLIVWFSTIVVKDHQVSFSTP
jgi:hypothetical protein